MGIAVCVRCGGLKRLPFARCTHCGFTPQGDRRAMAESLLLSDAYYDSERDHRPRRDELEMISRRIRSGETVEWDERIIAELIAEQMTLDREGSPSWLRIALLLAALLIIPLLALLVFILRRL